VQSIIAVLVLLNAVVMGIQTEWQANHFNKDTPAIFFFADVGFCCAFCTELIIRVLGFGIDFIRGPDVWWNCFDTTIILVSVFDLMSSITSEDGHKAASSRMSLLRTLRILRAVRAVRIVRVLRFVEELRTIVICIGGSMKSLAWTLLLLFMLIYMAGIAVTQVVLDYRQEVGDEKVGAIILYWYGSLTRTCVTLFEAITSGINYDEALAPLVVEISWLFYLFWIFYIAFTVFALLNVVTGVFVEKAVESANRDKSDFMMTHICDIFRRTDGTNAGKIGWGQFEESLSTEEMQEYFRVIDVDITEAKALYELLDADNDGMIDAVEFVSGCVRLTGHAKALDLSLLLFECRAMRSSVSAELREIKQMLQ
jgi:voltage-gated sodium channel